MRELLFRGQQRKKGEKVYLDGSPVDSLWFYGNGVFQCENSSIIYQREPDFDKHSVYSDTIGQYTGLTDKNGNKIFEGDIVWSDYEEERGIVQWDNDMAKFIITFSTFTVDFDSIYGGKLEIIGNIYDDHELLK